MPPVNDTERNGQSPLHAALDQRRYWVWESTLRGFVLGAYFNDAGHLKTAGLREWSDRENQQRGDFGYSHRGERLEYRRPTTQLDDFKSAQQQLFQERESNVPPDPPLPPVAAKETDDGIMRAICRLELASRFPWRTK